MAVTLAALGGDGPPTKIRESRQRHQSRLPTPTEETRSKKEVGTTHHVTPTSSKIPNNSAITPSTSQKPLQPEFGYNFDHNSDGEIYPSYGLNLKLIQISIAQTAPTLQIAE